MLKVIYTETGQHLEHVSSSLSSWLDRHHRLAKQTDNAIHIEVCTASILLPNRPDIRAALHGLQHQVGCNTFEWNKADADTIEVIMAGVWAASYLNSEEGAFLADLGDRTVVALVHLWSQTMAQVSAVSR